MNMLYDKHFINLIYNFIFNNLYIILNLFYKMLIIKN